MKDCKIRVKGKYNNMTLINMYALVEDKIHTGKEKLYESPNSDRCGATMGADQNSNN
jgi:hypothetical protein